MIYEFIDDEQKTIRHYSGMQFLILLNPKEGEYDPEEDTYQEFTYLGNHIVCLMLNPEDFEPLPPPIGYERINAINRKAFQWYRSKVFIPKKEK